MRSRHPRTAATFLVLGLLLLVSIAVGQRIGDRALFGSTERRSPVVAPLPTPVPEASADPGVSRNWKRLQVVSVATDPAFPDPRVTRPPTPSPRPTRTPPPPTLPPPPTAPPPPVPTDIEPPSTAPPRAGPPRAAATPRAGPTVPSYALPPVQYSQ
jgi:hypothetical protein